MRIQQQASRMTAAVMMMVWCGLCVWLFKNHNPNSLWVAFAVLGVVSAAIDAKLVIAKDYRAGYALMAAVCATGANMDVVIILNDTGVVGFTGSALSLILGIGLLIYMLRERNYEPEVLTE